MVDLKYKWLNKTNIILAIIAAVVTITGFTIKDLLTNSDDDNLQLTMYVSDANGNVIVENVGALTIDFGNDRRRALIGENGRTNFGEIPENFKGKEIKIGVEVPGYMIDQEIDKFVFTGEPIHLILSRDNSLCTIKGIVQDEISRQFIEGALIHVNADTVIRSDTNGKFSVVLPENMCLKNENNRYELTTSKIGYVTEVEHYNPLSSHAQIWLNPVLK